MHCSRVHAARQHLANLHSRAVQIVVAETEDSDALLHMAQSTR